MVKERNLAVAIILSLVTCGIYGIYWFIALTDETNAAAGVEGTKGITAFLLTLVTCGIYGLYWMYKQGEKIDTIKSNRGEASSNTGLIYLVLAIFGLGIVSYALMQNELNKVA
jgi:hypothetical protein